MSQPAQKWAISRTSSVIASAPASSQSVVASVTKSQSGAAFDGSNQRSWANASPAGS